VPPQGGTQPNPNTEVEGPFLNSHFNEVWSPTSPKTPSSRPHLAHNRITSSDAALNHPAIMLAAHENLDARLRPFWSKILPHRQISLSVYTIALPGDGRRVPETEEIGEPLIRNIIRSDAQGQFNYSMFIPWEILSAHPPSISSISARNEDVDQLGWALVIVAELLPDEQIPLCATSTSLPAKPALRRVCNGGSENGGLQQSEGRSTRSLGTSDASEEVSMSIKDHVTTPASDLDRSLTKARIAREIVRVSRAGGIRVVSDLVSGGLL